MIDEIMKPVQTAWLIEYTGSNSHTLYWGGGGYQHWVKDSLLAVRFSRKSDAERVFSMLGLNFAKSVEHMWVS